MYNGSALVEIDKATEIAVLYDLPRLMESKRPVQAHLDPK